MSFPWQNALTRPMRSASAKASNAELQSVWAGQGLRMLRQGAAGSIMAQLREEVTRALEKTCKSVQADLRKES
jgi:nitronate monooxygenase